MPNSTRAANVCPVSWCACIRSFRLFAAQTCERTFRDFCAFLLHFTMFYSKPTASSLEGIYTTELHSSPALSPSLSSYMPNSLFRFRPFCFWIIFFFCLFPWLQREMKSVSWEKSNLAEIRKEDKTEEEARKRLIRTFRLRTYRSSLRNSPRLVRVSLFAKAALQLFWIDFGFPALDYDYFNELD